MSELSLTACPICHAPGSLVRRTRILGAETYIWYECPPCGSVLLWLGNDRWAYQQIGVASRAYLLKQPLGAFELRAMLPAPATGGEPISRPAPPVPPSSPARVQAPAAGSKRAGAPAGDHPPGAARPATRQRPVPALVVGLVLFLLLGIVAMAGVIGAKLLAESRDHGPGQIAGQAQATATHTVTAPLPTATPSATWVPTLPPLPPPPTATLAPQVLAELDSIEAETARLRELARVPVTRQLMSRRDMVSHARQLFDAEYPPDKIEAEAQVLRLFGFLPENFDLRDWREAFYTSQTAGFYDEEDKALYVVSDGLGESLDAVMQFTFSHEYAHALDDQHFDLARVMDRPNRNEDELQARQALIEGSATYVSLKYMASLFGTGETAWESMIADRDVLSSAPDEIASSALFPYVEGFYFVSVLYAQGGWEAVNRAFADPPQSSEQILQPDRYLARDEPAVVALQPLTGTLGAGWHLVAANTLGQHQLSLYLALELDEPGAIAASRGWDGDRYALYANGDDQVLVMATVWDSVADREEFVAAYTRFAQARHQGLPGEVREAEIRWDVPGETTFLAWREASALFILAPNGALADQVLAVSRP